MQKDVTRNSICRNSKTTKNPKGMNYVDNSSNNSGHDNNPS